MSLERLIIYGIVTAVVMAGFTAVALFSWWYADRWAKGERRGGRARTGRDEDERVFVIRSEDGPGKPRA